MIPVGQPYRPAGKLDARSILITTILGTTAAVLGAGLIWLWEWSPIPTLVVVTPIVQGIGIGAVMAFAVQRLRMRNPGLVATVGFTCGLLSALLVHYGHYMHLVTAVSDQLRGEIAQNKTMPEPERQKLLTRLDADPAEFIDPMLVLQTGHSGFLGSMIYRNEQGILLKGKPVTGTILWVLWGAEALIVAVMAAVVPTGIAGQPFCEECGYWCEKQPDLFALPGATAAPLVEAVRADNPARVAELRASPPPYDESGLVGVTLHACPGCDQSFADVSHRLSTGKETKVIHLLKLHRISPEMATAMRTAPAPPLNEEIVEDHPEEGVVEEQGH